MKEIQGGVCAPKGFLAGSCRSGIRKSQTKDDLALITSVVPCTAAAVYTTNQVKAAPLRLTRTHLENGKAQAIIANSGNANACCNLEDENALRQAQAAAKALNLPVDDILVASTGVIGVTLPVEHIEEHVSDIELSDDGSLSAAKAIMTTDTFPKEAALEYEWKGKTIRLGGICKGSGMIHPNMGTMLAFVTTDAAIDKAALDKALLETVKKTFNRVSVDGDTSTNDMCIVMADGLAENETITLEDGYVPFQQALQTLCTKLARNIASDGEGASRLVSVTVSGADNEAQAETLAKSVASSSLVKAAMFGSDANWGRVLCAMGYSNAKFDPQTVSVSFSDTKASVQVCEKGKGLDFDEAKAKEILSAPEVEIRIDLHEGDASCTCWGCDLTYDYVRINGDYRT
jgi:glutamate N-acetyltransferase/amino-acid N-acetyltransferase